MSKKNITVQLIRSPISCTEKQKKCVTGLGLRKVGSTRVLLNNPCTRGMIKKIIHMLKIVE